MQPTKGSTDHSGVQALISDLKTHHFNVGKQSMPLTRTNEIYGLGVQSAKKPQKAPWANLDTNFALGTDKMNKTSDYNSRFAQATEMRSKSIGCSPTEEARRNKAKMTGDAVVIAENKYNHGVASSHAQYPDVFAASKNINKPMDKMQESLIKGSHFKTGYGPFGGVSENAGKFAK